MSKRDPWWERIFKNFKNRFLDTSEPIGVHAQKQKHPKQNHFIDNKQPQPQKYAVVNKEDLPTTLAGKINLTIGVIRKLILSAIVGFILLMGLGLGLATGYFCAIIKQEPIQSNTSLRNQIEKVDQSTTLYFAHNVKMERVPSDIRRQKVAFNQISPNLKKAVVATEDENFYRHHGVVPKSIFRAIISEITGFGTQTGGSTLTQQLVKMQLLSSETTWKRKATEILLATRLEKHFTKDQILESYLNVAPMGRNNRGQNIAGVQTAAQGIFNTNANNLTLAQAAFIAGLPQSPSVYTPYDDEGRVSPNIALGLRRKNVVLFRMYRNNDITKSQYQAAKKVDLRSQFAAHQPAPKTKIKYGYLYNLLTEQLQTHLIKQLAKEDNVKYADVIKDKDVYQAYSQRANRLMREHDYQVHSTIDKNIYDNMQSAFQQNANLLGTVHQSTATDPNTGKIVQVKEPVQNGSVLIDNHTGAVLGFVGGQDFQENQLNHAFDTQRSPGSSIKPMLVYAPAVEQGLIGSKTMLADFKAKFKKYAPTDFDNTIANKFVPADKALEQSLNIPAVNLYRQLQKSTNPKPYMDKMGLKLSNQEYQELGIALGGTRNGFTVTQAASAFSTFANQGVHVTPYYIDKITDVNHHVIYKHPTKKQRVFQPGTSYIMQKMMHSVITEGTASSLTYQLNFNYKNTFGKTGTSNDFRDNWFIGSTPGVTLASWIGYDNLYGHNYNLADDSTETNQSLWANLINSVYQVNPQILQADQKMAQPTTVNEQKVLTETGTLPGSTVYEGYKTYLSSPTSTSLFYKTHAKPLSKHFGIGGKDSNYKLFWDHYFGKINGYGVTNYLSDKTNKSSHRNGIGYGQSFTSNSIFGNYSGTVWGNNSQSSTNSESNNSYTNSTTSGFGGNNGNGYNNYPSTTTPNTPAVTTPNGGNTSENTTATANESTTTATATSGSTAP
ncbi:transglycosylase domain-containing protein [Bombilactobacillus bombi]|uniref:transglycosylase domain-containing protein n=1 Tax=Bombilactobacillus bombi TaxID=1303590 RepID=UPI0035F048A5